MKLIEIEIFKTDVKDAEDSNRVVKRLTTLFPESKINFDLDDCDRILRIEGRDFTAMQIKETVKELGFDCELLE